MRDYILEGFDEYDEYGVNLISDVDDYPFPITRRKVILAVDTNYLDKKKLIYFGEGWWRYYDSIPKYAIIEA